MFHLAGFYLSYFMNPFVDPLLLVVSLKDFFFLSKICGDTYGRNNGLGLGLEFEERVRLLMSRFIRLRDQHILLHFKLLRVIGLV